MNNILEILGELGSYVIVFGPTLVSMLSILVTIIKTIKNNKSLKEYVEKIISAEQNEYKEQIKDLVNKLSDLSKENLELKQIISIEKKTDLKIALSEGDKNVIKN